MKRVILFFFLSIFGIHLIFAQNQNELSETDKLFVTSKVWGFLKYYHPNVAKGAFNWDRQLFDILPEVKKSKTKNEFSNVLLNWLSELGEYKGCKRCGRNKNELFSENFDLSWLQDLQCFNEDVADKLELIRSNRSLKNNYYAQPGKGNAIEIQNEKVYEDFDYTNENYSLLALFKYWNIIEYFYPYKYLTDQKWDDVLMEMIPKFQHASNKTQYRLTLEELVAKLDDAHSNVIFDDTTSRKYLAAKIKEIGEKAVVSGFFNDSIGKLSKFKLGDVILRVDGVDLGKKMPEKLKYIAGSNINIKRRNAYYSLLKGEDSIANITVVRNTDTVEFKANRYPYKNFYRFNRNLPSTAKSRVINDSIGYMSMAYINGDEAAEAMERFMDMKAIIIDLRNYPNFIYWVVTRFLNEKKKDFARIYVPDISYPGKFKFLKNERTGVRNRKAYKGKVFILVDDESFSRSEFTAMAFQTANNVMTIGSPTVGSDGNVTSFTLPDGSKTYMSGVGILYPDGTPTQRVGVKIDIEVTPTINGLQQGHDEVLEKAVELAKE